MLTSIKFEVFGQSLVVERRAGRWVAFYPGPDGKRRLATDIVIPSDTAEQTLTNISPIFAMSGRRQATNP